MKLQIHRAARAEQREAATRYAAIDEVLAERFVVEVAYAYSQIVEHPDRWPRHQKDTQRYRLHGFPFNVIYRALSDRVRIIAVAHTSRAPDYWEGRR